jgi:hypothetical protein
MTALLVPANEPVMVTLYPAAGKWQWPVRAESKAGCGPNTQTALGALRRPASD